MSAWAMALAKLLVVVVALVLALAAAISLIERHLNAVIGLCVVLLLVMALRVVWSRTAL